MSEAGSGTLPTDDHVDGPGDAELISAVRGGDVDAYGVLFERHVDAARRLARQLTSSGDADDLVSDAFAKVLGVLQRGGGPDVAFRAYLLTSVRRLHVDKIRSNQRLHTTDDLDPFDPGVPFVDTAVASFESGTAARAFASLPERWQLVLWHTEVEGQKPAEIAPLLGMSPNSVAALAYRAREGLRQAFVSMHAQDAGDDECDRTRANLGAFIRGGVSRRDTARIEAHLKDCRGCTGIYLELTEVNSNIGAVLAPLVLGSVPVAAYLTGTKLAAAGATGGAVLAFDRAKSWAASHTVVASVAAVAAAVLIAAGLAFGISTVVGDGPPPPAVAGADETPPADEAGSETDPSPTEPTGESDPTTSASPTAPADPSDPTDPADEPSDLASDGPSGAPSPSLSPAASADPSEPSQPSQPSGGPADSPPGGAAVENSDPVVGTGVLELTTSGQEPVTINVVDGATDADGDALYVASAVVAQPAHGTVAIGPARATTAAGRYAGAIRPKGPQTIVYHPPPGWSGVDTVRYVLTDGNGGIASGQVRIRVDRSGEPTAHGDAAAAGGWWHAPEAVVVPVLANDERTDGGRVTISRPPAHGRATVRGTSVVYTPRRAAPVTSDTFEYTVTTRAGSAAATVTIALPGPLAVPDATSTGHNQDAYVDVLANDHGANLAVASVGDVRGGTARVVGHGGRDGRAQVLFDPHPDFAGVGGFSYTVTDAHGRRARSTATVTVQPKPRSNLVARDDQVKIQLPLPEGFGAWIPVLANDEALDPTLAVTSQPRKGRAEAEPDAIRYTPDPFRFDGRDTFRYAVTDGAGNVRSAAVTVLADPRPADVLLTHELSWQHDRYHHIRLVLEGLPPDERARVEVTLSGVERTDGYGLNSPCPRTGTVPGDLVLSCEFTGDGGPIEILHYDVVTSPEWSLEAAVELPLLLRDSTPDNNRVTLGGSPAQQ